MLSAPRPLRAPGLATLVAALALLSGGCTDHAKVSEERATRWVTDVARRATDDVGNFQKGLPAGAAQLATLFAQGGVPADDLPAVRQGLRRIRVDVPELAHASSTFFALTDAKGIAIRNDLEQDVMAGQDVWKLFPELRKTTEQPFVAAGGLFAGARATGDPDRDWVAATPLKDAHGAFAGMLLGGFTMKRLAIHLTETLRQDLLDEQAKTKDLDKLPITFVSVFDGAGVFSSPSMPEVNHKALVDLGLGAKTASGTAHGVLTISDRDFGWAATRVPAVEPEAGVVLLWSEI